MSKWFAAIALAAVLTAGPATAQPDAGTGFEGVAHTGSDTREVRFRLFCSSNDGPDVTGVLSVELEVPRYEQLRPIFDFDPFEGPDAHAGALTILRASGARSKTNERFSAAGSAEQGADSALSFVLEVTASRREARPLRKLAATLRPLLEGPARLVWRQESAKSGGPPMIATLDLSGAQIDRLHTALGPCLNGR